MTVPEESTFLGMPLRKAILINLQRSWFPKSLNELVNDFRRPAVACQTALDELSALGLIISYTHPARNVPVWQPVGRTIPRPTSPDSQAA